MTEARATVEQGRRRELYGQAQALMHKEVPSIIPVFFDLLTATRDYVEGYRLHPRGAVFRLDHVWLRDGAPRAVRSNHCRPAISGVASWR